MDQHLSDRILVLRVFKILSKDYAQLNNEIDLLLANWESKGLRSTLQKVHVILKR